MRCCVDFRNLNVVTKRDAYPLPRTDACLDALNGARWFTTLDMRSSYHQVELEPSAREKTAFICREGAYRYTTMPMGLCYAGATFQRLMDTVLARLNFEALLVYLDDVIIFSTSPAQHLDRLEQVLDRLGRAGLRLRPNKCEILRRSVEFVGHLVSADGIRAHPNKIAAVTEWPVPVTVRDVRGFLGLCSYYRRFVARFAEVASPLYAFTEKNRSFSWTSDCQRAFEQLKQHLTSAPILCTPSDGRKFILDTDASDGAIGAVLSQDYDGQERVVAYASRRLSKAELNYCVTRKELLAVVHFAKYFRHFLLGREFTVRTDHAALQWLRKMPQPIGQQARWLEILEEFTFRIEHRAGQRHGNADALSRRPCDRRRCCPTDSHCETDRTSNAPVSAPTDSHHSVLTNTDTVCVIEDATQAGIDESNTAPISASGHGLWTETALKDGQDADPDLRPVISFLNSKPEPPSWDEQANLSEASKAILSQWSRLVLKDGVLCRKFIMTNTTPSETRLQVIVPRSHRQSVLELAHAGTMGGHFGRKKTQESVRARAYWPGWTEDIKVYIGKCVPCAMYHRGKAVEQTTLRPFVAGDVWETVSIDITGPHPRSNKGNVFILTLVDHFSKWAEAIPLRNHTAPTVAKALFDHVFCRFGMPRRILSDQGAEFESVLFRDLCDLMAITKVRSSPYKPSTNGTVERFHLTLNRVLAKIISQDQRNWCTMLPYALAAYRATVHESTAFTPSRVFLGRETTMPIDLVMSAPIGAEITSRPIDEWVAERRDRCVEIFDVVRESLNNAATVRKNRYDAGIKTRNYKEGDWVYYLYPRRRSGVSPKWQSCFSGPFLIVRIIDSHNVVLQRSRRAKQFVVHRDKLKLCYGDTPTDWRRRPESAVAPTAPRGEHAVVVANQPSPSYEPSLSDAGVPLTIDRATDTATNSPAQNGISGNACGADRRATDDTGYTAGHDGPAAVATQRPTHGDVPLLNPMPTVSDRRAVDCPTRTDRRRHGRSCAVPSCDDVRDRARRSVVRPKHLTDYVCAVIVPIESSMPRRKESATPVTCIACGTTIGRRRDLERHLSRYMFAGPHRRYFNDAANIALFRSVTGIDWTATPIGREGQSRAAVTVDSCETVVCSVSASSNQSQMTAPRTVINRTKTQEAVAIMIMNKDITDISEATMFLSDRLPGSSETDFELLAWAAYAAARQVASVIVDSSVADSRDVTEKMRLLVERWRGGLTDASVIAYESSSARLDDCRVMLQRCDDRAVDNDSRPSAVNLNPEAQTQEDADADTSFDLDLSQVSGPELMLYTDDQSWTEILGGLIPPDREDAILKE